MKDKTIADIISLVYNTKDQISLSQITAYCVIEEYISDLNTNGAVVKMEKS